MRILKLIINFSVCLIATRSMAQSAQAEPPKYRKFAVYAGVGPSYFFNNLVAFKNDVNSFNYAFSMRFMWEPQHSFLSLGLESGYYRLYSVKTTIPADAKVINTAIPIQFIVSMKFSKEVYANWSMGQSFLFNKVDVSGSTDNFNAQATSLADFSLTVGYRFVQKARISYAAELKGYYSSSYANGTISLLFIVGFKL